MTQLEALRAHFDAGGSLTVADALRDLGIYALSQRCGELEREGYPVISRMIALPNGKHVAQYFKATAAPVSVHPLAASPSAETQSAAAVPDEQLILDSEGRPFYTAVGWGPGYPVDQAHLHKGKR